MDNENNGDVAKETSPAEKAHHMIHYEMQAFSNDSKDYLHKIIGWYILWAVITIIIIAECFFAFKQLKLWLLRQVENAGHHHNNAMPPNYQMPI